MLVIKPAPEQEGHTTMNLNKLFTALRQLKNTPACNLQAERRKRYTHALEQFLDGQPATRLGGAYTLVNLIDEWLADASLPEQVRLEEAQTIIDALTECIRTPYPLAQKRQALAVQSSWNSVAASPQSPKAAEQAIRRTSTRCRQYRQHGQICASILAAHPSSTRYGSCTFRTPISPLQPSTARLIFPAHPSAVTPAFLRHSSRLTHPSTARTSTTGWGSAPHTSRARQSSAGRISRTRQASQP